MEQSITTRGRTKTTEIAIFFLRFYSKSPIGLIPSEDNYPQANDREEQLCAHTLMLRVVANKSAIRHKLRAKAIKCGFVLKVHFGCLPASLIRVGVGWLVGLKRQKSATPSSWMARKKAGEEVNFTLATLPRKPLTIKSAAGSAL